MIYGMSRTSAAARNVLYSVGQQLATIVLSFATRTALIHTLGLNYVGVNGLFSSILTVLSFAELGLGSAITFHLYAPLAHGRTEEIKSLMRVYRNFYRLVGVAIFVLGLSLMPALPFIIKDYHTSGISNLELIFALMVVNSATSYFFTYKHNLLAADQKDYVRIRVALRFSYASKLAQIIVLLLLQDFILYILVGVVSTLLSNAVIARKVDRMYPYVADKDAQPLGRERRAEILKYAGATLSHKVGRMVIGATDNIVLSSMVGIQAVGVYANYTLVISAIDLIFANVGSAIVSSVGNLHASGDRSHSEITFNRVYYAYRWAYMTIAPVVFCCLNRFIGLWVGESSVFEVGVLALIVLNFYISGMRHVVTAFISGGGLYHATRFRPVWESALNLIISVIAVRYLGVAGVLLGTFVAYLIGSIWYDPRVLYREWFGTSARPFMLRYLSHFVITCVLSIALYLLSEVLFDQTWVGLILTSGTALVVASFTFWVLFRREDHYLYYKRMLWAALGRLGHVLHV